MNVRLLLFFLPGIFLFCPLRAQSPERPPNIILIISDDHAWSDYGFMEHPVVQTPSIDRLVSEGLLFTRAYVPAAVCRPSLASIITGFYPHQHGITGNDPPGGRETISDPERRAEMVDVFRKNETIAAMLGGIGYVSLQTGKWWEGNPLDHGFTAAMTHGDVMRGGRHGDEGLTIGREGLQPIYEFIEEAADHPFFIWYAPFLPHTPHNPPDRLYQKYEAPDRPPEVTRYYAMIEWFDETVGELLGYIDRQGLRENTVILYLADNGWIQAVAPFQMPDTRSKMSPYEAGIRTPLIIRWPGRIQPRREETRLITSLDIAPTILRVAGLEPPAEMPGVNLLDKRTLTDRKTFFGALFAHTAVDVNDPRANLKYRYVIQEDGWKLILPYVPNRDVTLMINGRVSEWMRFEPELYHVLDDPFERLNLANDYPESVTDLQALIDDWWTPDSE